MCLDTVINTPFTQGLRPLCLPCATTKLTRWPLMAERRQNGCRGRSRVAHRTFRHRHGLHEVLSMFKTVAQMSQRRSVAHRSLKGGRRKAHTLPWSLNGCTVVGHWSPHSGKAQGSYCSSYTESELSGFGGPLSVLTIFWSLKGGTKVTALCKGGFSH